MSSDASHVVQAEGRFACFRKRYLLIGTVLSALLFFGAIPVDAQVLPPDTYALAVHSQPGDPWSSFFHKSDWSYQASDGQFVCLGFDWVGDGSLNHLTFSFNGYNGERWQLALTTRSEITEGEYEGVFPAFYVGGLGRSCVPDTGTYKVLQIAHEGSGNFIHITKFAVTFEHHCYGLQAALTGFLYFNSNGILPPEKLGMKTRPPLPDAVVGAYYSQRLEVEGGTAPYNWDVTAGQLPPGLALDARLGIISGIPGSYGQNTFTVRAIDSAPFVNGYPSQVVYGAFSIGVNPSEFTIEDGLPPTATIANDYNYQFKAVGGTLPYQWSLVNGSLPPGLILGNDGKLSGNPSSPGAFMFTLRAKDSAEHQLERKYALMVIDPPKIATAKYKPSNRKLTISGVKFDLSASLLIDGLQIKPKYQDSESFIVKPVELTHGSHELRILNPDGGSASVMVTID